MNDRFFHEQCDKCARRILRQPDEAARVNEAFRLAYQRLPTEGERQRARRFLHDYRAELTGSAQEQAAWSALARILLASNEFLFLE
jgi:hypothetical protein